MSLTKKRNKKLWCIIIIAMVVLVFAVLVGLFVQDDYVAGWLVSVSQALMVFAIFRFQKLKDIQKKSKVIWKITKAVFAVGVFITAVGLFITMFCQDWIGSLIARIGSFAAGLGINGFVCYLGNEFDNIEEIENKEKRRIKRKEYRRKVALSRSK